MASRMMRLSPAEYDKMLERKGVAKTGNGTKAASAGERQTSVSAKKESKQDFGKIVSPTKYKSRAIGGYQSTKEARYAANLRIREKAGEVKDITEQVKYLLIPAQEGERPCYYWLDFRFQEKTDLGWFWRYVDVKGYKKGQAYALFVVKRKLLLQVHKIRIIEV